MTTLLALLLAPPPAGVAVHRDLAYVAGGHDRQTLDLYLPPGDRPRPVVVWLHGGAWRGGGKADPPAAELLARGFAVASVNYRLSQHAPFPAQLHDCKAAVRWLRANAAKYHLDPDRVGAWGYSAGGHLALLLATAGDAKLRAAVSFAGPTDLAHMGGSHDGPDSPESKLLGGPVPANKAKADAASPVSYASADDPPTLLVHGDDDRTVPVDQSRRLADALKKAGADVTLVTLPGVGHGGLLGPEQRGRAGAFFTRHLLADPGRVEDRTFRSDRNARDVTVKVYLPPGYDAGTDRYPVVYNLHGGNGSPRRQWDRVRKTLTAAVDTRQVRPVIYVFVDGLGGDTFFIDHAAGGPQVATMIATELVPWVDRTYRTVAGKRGRAVDGFSMGGFGALMIAFRHPELFGGVVSYGAALIDPLAEDPKSVPTADAANPDAPGAVARKPGRWGDKAHADRFNPRTLAVANADAIRAGLRVRVVCGDADKLYPLNVSFKDQLDALKIPVDWVPVPGVAHDTKGLFDRVGVESLRFLQAGFDAPAPAGELGRGEVYSVVEVRFAGPPQAATDTPARDVELRATFRHESGLAHTVHGFFDGDGTGGAAGGVFAVRFCPTKPGRWELAEVRSNRKELAGQRQGGFVTATAGTRPGFWEVDAAHAGGRWFKRSDGSHPYVFGNTAYSFLSGTRDTGPVADFDPAAEVHAHANQFRKLRFALTADRYPHPTAKPFLDAGGKPTDDGDHSARPNPNWFHTRADPAVRTAYARDLVADLILCGPDTDASRATLRAGATGGDPLPWLRYVAARYGSFPNVWVCLCNEYDIKGAFPPADVARWGVAMKGLLPYPTPLSVHASQYPDGKGKPAAWPTALDALPGWNSHQILQRKIRTLAASADVIRLTRDNPGGRPRPRPTVNDELSYQGAGDRHTEGDTLASHLGAFVGGGYASTGYKSANKLGHYFWGGFDPQEHTAAPGLKFLREMIDTHVGFWRMTPGADCFPDLPPAFRAMGRAGHEYVVGTDRLAAGLVADLPPGAWAVRRFDAVARIETVLGEAVRGRYTFNAPLSGAVLFHFKRVGD